MKSKAFNITMPEELVKKIDLQAKKQFSNRSELIRAAAVAYFEKLDRWNEHFRYGEEKARELGIKNEEEVAQIVSNDRQQTPLA